MENTGSNSQSMSASQVIEMICSVVLLVCLFLPWVTMFNFSVTAFDVINWGAKVNRAVSYGLDYASVSGGGFGTFMITVFLFIHLIMFIANPIVQYYKRMPWLSFYTAWIPVSIALMIWYKTTIGGSDEYAHGGFYGMNIGAGAVLTMLAGLLMQFSAWTTIGVHYKKFRKYFSTALIWCIAGWLCYIVGIAISTSKNSFMYDLFSYSSFTMLLIILIIILATLGIGHTLWLIYGGIVMFFSSTNNPAAPEPAMQSVQEKPDDFLDQVRKRSDEDLKNILQHKADYNEQLVRAAKEVMLERISNPVAATSSPVTSSSVASTPLAETTDDKSHAYQPSVPTLKPMPERETASSASDDGVIKSSWTIKPKEETKGIADAKPVETIAPATPPSKKKPILIISIIAGVLLIAAGALGYFLWYAPYVKDRDAPRTYVVANNVFLRSSRMSGVEYNILAKIPYGTEVITYTKFDEWADVKVEGQEGVIASPYLLDSDDFVLLNSVWGDSDAKECIESSKCRLAILDYLKKNHVKTGPDAWVIYTRPINQKPNTVFYPRLYNKNSKYTDFMFILGDNATGNRVLVCYSFEDTTEKPIFRFSTGTPQAGFIKNVVNRYGKVQVIFDTNQVVNISL